MAELVVTVSEKSASAQFQALGVMQIGWQINPDENFLTEEE